MFHLCDVRHEKSPTSPRGASLTGTQRTLLLRARATIAKTKEFVKRVGKIIETKRITIAADSEVHRDFGEASVRSMLAGTAAMLRKLGFSI